MHKNSDQQYGNISRIIHWLSALFVVGLFILGLWMVGLDYYDDWYRKGPDLHRSFGVVLMVLTVLRLFWYRVSPKPKPLSTHSRTERMLAVIIHHSLMSLLFVMFISGYLITTAQGESLFVFNIFSIPSVIGGIANLEDVAGEVHEISAFIIIGLVCFHVLGAFKHHFFDKDTTLKRMLGRRQ